MFKMIGIVLELYAMIVIYVQYIFKCIAKFVE